jgi:hypothetical protein
MLQLRTEIGQAMPVSLVLVTDGKHGNIVFIKTAPFSAVIDINRDGKVCATFGQDGFTIGEEEYSYNIQYPYKDMPILLEWLKSQNLIMSANMF